MNKHVLSLAFVALSVVAAFGITFHRSFRNGYPSGAQGVVGGTGRTVGVIDGWERLADVNVGDVIAFKGEFVSNPKGGVVHWTHPDNSHRKPGGWLKN